MIRSPISSDEQSGTVTVWSVSLLAGTLILCVQYFPTFANSVDPDQMFVILFLNLYQRTASRNPIGYQSEVVVAN